MEQIRRAAVAGSWYPQSAQALAEAVDGHLARAARGGQAGGDLEGDLVAIVSPHAGLVYSGPVAAHAYRLLRDRRFDVAVLKHYLAVDTFPLYCTKLASKLTRTYTDRHGLKDLVKELLGIELNKQQQSSDWGAHMLSDAQKQYAAQDVLYLHELKARLDQMLEREGRGPLARACFDFVPTRASLDLAGWTEEDVFAH